MDIVLNSRHCELTDKFRAHVEEKLARLEKHDQRVIRVEVEVEKERNPRQADRAVRVELTAFSKGPVVRAEAAAEDKMAALDLALDRMVAQMRRAADRNGSIAAGTPRCPWVARWPAIEHGARWGRSMDGSDPGRGGQQRPRRADRGRRATGRWWCGRRPTRPRR